MGFEPADCPAARRKLPDPSTFAQISQGRRGSPNSKPNDS
jgi:hypothetical protein